MQTFKFFLVSLLVMLSTSAFAQGVVVHKTDGTTVIIHEVDSVVYTTSAIGYYSFKATSKAEIPSLTEADFTKLTEATSEVPCGVKGIPVVLTEGTTAPTFAAYSNVFSKYGDDTTMRPGYDAIGTTKTINGKTYNIWYWATTTDSSDNPKVKFIIK